MMKTLLPWLGLLACSTASFAADMELSGNLDVQWRAFAHDAVLPEQHASDISFSAEPEFYFDLDQGKESVIFTPFYRYDQHDSERTHSDIRELQWQKVFAQFQLRLGISKVYWGVTESEHLVDIINQTDQVENLDGEDKLGQPMIYLSSEQDWGLLDLFILPGFRERTFPGIEGRPRISLPIAADAAVYQSADKQHHIDYALRLFKYLGDWEVGLSYFKGTGREPESYQPSSFDTLGQPVAFAPYYAQIGQLGLTVQALIEAWTWKLEAISRSSSAQHFNALAAGFEYTFVGVQESNTDLGVVIEYLYDQRDPSTNPSQPVASAFQNDITTAFRLSFNDAQSSEVLFGMITDLDNQAVAGFIEASRRLGSSFKAELELRTFNNTRSGQLLHSFRDDDFIQLRLGWYF
jgi:hypothetical protein